ncbi:MAG TPA: permease [Actinomycetota bacterium]|nr:permease [Actinomycetota bacterium]
MAQAALTPIDTRSAWRRSFVAVAALAGIAVVLNLLNPARIPALQNFLLVFSSLLIEAMPFILLGAVVSAVIEVFVPRSVFDRLASLPRAVQLPAAGLTGFAFPVCECGSVPVARRLAHKGLSAGAAVTFMLAAPILNPVVLVSTIIAYRGRDILVPIVVGRATLGLLAALAVGWIVANKTSGELLSATAEDDEHAHHADSRAGSFFSHLTGDFIFMGRFLVLGAAVAATMQTFVPQTWIASIADTPFLSLIAMMALAFVLSLCSESDAFVAASFVQFGVGAQLAFLVFGPLVDTKLAFLYSGTFSREFLRTVVLVVGAVVFAGTLWVEVIVG